MSASVRRSALPTGHSLVVPCMTGEADDGRADGRVHGRRRSEGSRGRRSVDAAVRFVAMQPGGARRILLEHDRRDDGTVRGLPDLARHVALRGGRDRDEGVGARGRALTPDGHLRAMSRREVAVLMP